MSSSSRSASHAGSWYSSNGKALAAELDANLARVNPLPDLAYDPPVQDCKAIIAPHAGYSYSGPAAAWAYAAVPTDKIKTIFLLGPSHHVYLRGVALSNFKTYSTPVGELPLCLDTINELRETGLFEEMSPATDEDEHSLEMHLPYVRHVFAGRDDVRLVPLLVGNVSAQASDDLNEALSPYWSRDDTFWIISSDFCHWGSRFSHMPYYPNAPSPVNPVPPVNSGGSNSQSTAPLQLVKRFSSTVATDVPIWKSIQYMDHEGMELLKDPTRPGAVDEWLAYLKRTENTICGRNPITLLLRLIQYVGTEAASPRFTFVRYEQSSQCTTARDSSVSYVSGVLRQ